MATLIERPHKISYSKNDIRYVFELTDLERSGLFLQVKLLYTKMNMTSFEEIMTFDLKPDQNGFVHLYLQAYIDSVLNYNLPEIGKLFNPANDQFCGFFIHYREFEDAFPNQEWQTNEETEQPLRMAIKGGIEKHKFSKNNFFVNYWEPSGAFLTWQPSGKFIYENEDAYLTFINDNFDTTDYVIRVRTVSTTGLVNIAYIPLPATEAYIAHVKVDPQALNLAAHVTGQIHYYEVSIMPDMFSPAITTTHTFYIQYRPQYYYYDFVYHNSPGGIDTIRVKGDVTESFERQLTEINAGFNLNDWTGEVKIHETRHGNLQVRRKYKGDMGYQRSKAEQSALVELLLSPGIYQLIGNRYVPLLTLQKEQDLGYNNDLKKSFPIEWSLSEQNEVYTPIEMNFGETVSCDPMNISETITLPDATIGQPYLAQVGLDSGTPPITIAAIDAQDWLSFEIVDGYLQISGTPNVSGSISFNVTLENCAGQATMPLTLNVQDECVPVVITEYTLPNAISGQPYEAFIFFDAGSPPFSLTWTFPWFISGAQLVGDNSIKITGSPTTTGTYSIPITVSNCGASVPLDLTLNVVNGQPVSYWNYTNAAGVAGRFKILVNGTQRVNSPVSGNGTLNLSPGDHVEVIVTAPLDGLATVEINGPYNNTSQETHIITDDFIVTSGIYTINGFSDM